MWENFHGGVRSISGVNFWALSGEIFPAIFANFEIKFSYRGKEKMTFKKPVSADGRVEDWMTAVLQEMRSTNRKDKIFSSKFPKTQLKSLAIHPGINEYYITNLSLNNFHHCTVKSRA